ncbi:MAG: GtrA family protein [Gammaproteobacteria bacterium]|nr:GtrA family protein [Gammaproteobacteria bacterium]
MSSNTVKVYTAKMINAGKQIINTSKGNSLIQPIRFALSGSLATASHWLVMALMVNSGTLPAIATAVGAFIGAIVNYILQRNVTFQSNVAHRSALLRYVAICTLTWFLNLAFFLIFYQVFQLSLIVAQGITTLAIALMSYFLYKRIVFNEHQSQSI